MTGPLDLCPCGSGGSLDACCGRMRLYRLESKRAAVQLALERLVGERMSTEDILAMQGTGYPLDNEELEGLDEPVDLSGARLIDPR